MQTDKEFEDFFREKLDGAEETPPAGAWNKISNQIKSPRTYYRELAAIALLCLLSVIAFLNLRQEPEMLKQTALTNATNQETQLPRSGEKTISGDIAATADNTAQAQANPVSAPAGNAAEATRQELNQPEISISAAKNQPLLAENGASLNGGKNEDLNGQLLVADSKKKKPARTEIQTKANVPAAARVAILPVNPKTPVQAVAAENRYENEAKNSAPKVTQSVEKTETIAAKTTQPETTTSVMNTPVILNEPVSETSAANTDLNPVASQPEMVVNTIAQNQMLKPDTNALKTVPPFLTKAQKDADQAVAKEDPKKKTAKKGGLTVNVTPGIIARRLIANPDDEKYLQFKDYGNTKRTADLGFDLSAVFHHPVTTRTTLDAGLSFTQLTSNVDYSVSNGQLNIVSQTVADGSQTAEVKVNYAFAQEHTLSDFTYGGLRLGLTQQLLEKSGNTLFVSGGAGLNMLLSKSGSISTTPEDSSLEPIQSALAGNAFHNVNSHVYLRAGLRKQLLPRISVVVAPALTYYLNSVLRKEHAFQLKPYTLGLNFGLHYQF